MKIQIQKYKCRHTNGNKNIIKPKARGNEFGCQWVCMPYWKAVCKFVKLRLSGRAQCATSYLSLSSERRFTRVQKYSRQEINYIGDQKYWRPKIRYFWDSSNLPFDPRGDLCYLGENQDAMRKIRRYASRKVTGNWWCDLQCLQKKKEKGQKIVYKTLR